jgi:hypothetical protein
VIIWTDGKQVAKAARQAARQAKGSLMRSKFKALGQMLTQITQNSDIIHPRCPDAV